MTFCSVRLTNLYCYPNTPATPGEVWPSLAVETQLGPDVKGATFGYMVETEDIECGTRVMSGAGLAREVSQVDWDSKVVSLKNIRPEDYVAT